jgi:AsmA family protein
LPRHEVSGTATIDHGVLKVAPLVGEVLGGRATVYLTLDATREVPVAHVDLKIADLQLGRIARKDPQHPPMEGPMRASLEVVGKGSSLHAVAASADGTLKLQVAHGAIRESLAELTGIDLRGLGLLLAKDKQDIPVNCAVATLAAHGGSLTVQNLLADTDSVLITGQGQIHLDNENLDLEIRGQPKGLRLFRLRAPVAVRGTLLHPSIGIEAHKSSLVIVDPGTASDADCATLLAQFTAGDAHAPSH